MKKSHAFSYFTCVMVGALILYVMMVACSSESANSSNDAGIQISGMRITQQSCSLAVGDDFQLTVTATPSYAAPDLITWISSNSEIASVNNVGLVHGFAIGNVTITASAGSLSSTCEITVTERVVLVTSITVEPKSLNLVHPAFSQLVATILPPDATDKRITYSSSDPSIVTIDEMGMVTTVGAGIAIVTVRANNGALADTCTVTVSLPIIAATSISLSPPHLSLMHPASQQLTAEVLPADATDKAINFASSDTSVATVDIAGLVSSVAPGNAVITATTHGGIISATSTVTVTLSVIPVTSIALNRESIALIHPSTAQLVAAVLPEDATDKAVTFSTSDPLVAIVDSSGTITTMGGGTTTITATTSDGTHSAQCLITVTMPVTAIVLSPETMSLAHPSSGQLAAIIQPASASNKEVSFTTSNPAVAVVNATGLVTTVGAGSAIITATSIDGGYSDSSAISVTIPVTAIAINPKTFSLVIPASGQLIVTIAPANATDRSYHYASSDLAVASINAAGLVTSVGRGTAVITVTSNDGAFTDICNVVVIKAVTSVELEPDTLALVHPSSRQLVATVRPPSASNKSVAYSSSDIRVALVSSNGVVTTVGAGHATITVTTIDGNFSDFCTVSVTMPHAVSDITAKSFIQLPSILSQQKWQ